ncbi:MAG TPA: protein-L-isoaspartate(D-aspartate) O-methyltransferase [Candidatus Thermoplasmatota archaeon]|jgi:protein-L-isoaspartate(D-aspartate) O-methyltransferase|nr:protein-L-isoaspartate(D-aspartate) O-methyltransferase [Candidatus Thermoplasmatota archaeon]
MAPDPWAEARERMVQGLLQQGTIRSPRVADAMRRVPRHLFLPADEARAYDDRPLAIGEGQTISAPHMVGIMAEALQAQPGMAVLEVGAGSGYHAAIVAELVAPGGKVWSVERFADLAAQARANLQHAGFGEDRVEIVVGDGSVGLQEHAPYDRAYVTCAAPSVPPPILEQLRAGGRALVPVGDRWGQELMLVEKEDDRTFTRGLGGCVFVPLVGKYGFAEATTKPP